LHGSHHVLISLFFSLCYRGVGRIQRLGSRLGDVVVAIARRPRRGDGGRRRGEERAAKRWRQRTAWTPA
jgi:hypothetical protein